jgi:hypothetical protein
MIPWEQNNQTYSQSAVGVTAKSEVVAFAVELATTKILLNNPTSLVGSSTCKIPAELFAELT